MKKDLTSRDIRLWMVIAVGLVTAVAVSGLARQHAFAGSGSRKAHKIIKRHIKALGGMKTIETIDNMTATGYLEAGGFQVDFTLWMQPPNKSRMDISIRGIDIIQGYDGEMAWWLNPLAGASEPTEMPEDFARAMIRWTEFGGPLVKYKKKRHRASYVGERELDDGRSAHDIELIRADGEVWHLFIDSQTYLEVMRSYEQTFEGRTMEVITRFSDFVEVEGLTTPRVIEGVGVEGSPYRLVFETIETVEKIDEEFFSIAGALDR